MRKHKSIFLLILLLGFAVLSCKPIYKLFIGIKKSKVENYNSVREIFKKYYQNTPGIVCVAKDSTSIFKIWKKIRSYPKTQFFNKNGWLIITQDSGYCYAKAQEFVLNMSKDDLYKIDTSFHLNEILDLITPIDEGTTLSFIDFDFIFIGYWSASIGRGNKNVYVVSNELNKHSDLKIFYLFVNLDIMEEWNCVSLKKSQ
jgi:hypothetical protein